jgi:hypothetical protein
VETAIDRRCQVPTDDRNLLDVLKFELNVLDKGGYGSSPREPWRPHFVFEDSPTCMNYDSRTNPAPCSECVLMQLVPPEAKGELIPCRHIPITPEGEALAAMYRYGSQQEIEDAVRTWLRATIQSLETERGLEIPHLDSAPVCRVACRS